MNAGIETAAMLVTVLGVASFVTAYAATRTIRSALPVLLDFLTAAGMIRLAADPSSWMSLVLVAAVITVRRMVAFGIAHEA
ncbi:hypothetical protein ACWGI0_06225 [Streptomyces sp. NPDC054802]